ncbi:hypothetical protein [Streptomyces zaomyceticus]|uniref:hypothetical protein n=1 Tax=Streptomyces zaomyceticus TaxID=68286 RepID=UPI00369E30BC
MRAGTVRTKAATVAEWLQGRPGVTRRLDLLAQLAVQSDGLVQRVKRVLRQDLPAGMGLAGDLADAIEASAAASTCRAYGTDAFVAWCAQEGRPDIPLR